MEHKGSTDLVPSSLPQPNVLPFGMQAFHQNQVGVHQLPAHIQHPLISLAQLTANASGNGSGKKRGRKGHDGEEAPGKRPRPKKAPDAPKRPKSAYMFFLAEFREKWKQENPDSKKVADVARAAGEIWRQMSEEKKNDYEVRSTGAKAAYASAMQEYELDHPKPARRAVKLRDPAELKRPQSAYFFFLHDFRENYKVEHPGEQLQVSVLGKMAGEKWKAMAAEEKAPYEQMSTLSKAEYAKQKMLTPDERRMYAAATASAIMQTLTASSPMPAIGGQGLDMQSFMQLQSMASGSLMQQAAFPAAANGTFSQAMLPSPGIPMMQQNGMQSPQLRPEMQQGLSSNSSQPMLGHIMPMGHMDMSAAANMQQAAFNVQQVQFMQQLVQQQVMAGMLSGQQAMQQQAAMQQQQANAAAGMLAQQQAMAGMQHAAGTMLVQQQHQQQPMASAANPAMHQFVAGFPAQQQHTPQLALQQHMQGQQPAPGMPQMLAGQMHTQSQSAGSGPLPPQMGMGASVGQPVAPVLSPPYLPSPMLPGSPQLLEPVSGSPPAPDLDGEGMGGAMLFDPAHAASNQLPQAPQLVVHQQQTGAPMPPAAGSPQQRAEAAARAMSGQLSHSPIDTPVPAG